MSSGQIATLVVAALLVFWMLGAYNRLVALRNAVGAAFAQVDEVLQRRSAAVPPLVDLLRERLPEEQGALEALLASQVQVHAAAQALRVRPLAVALVEALVHAEANMASAQARVLALVEQQPALLAEAGVAPHVGTLREAAPRLVFVRQLYNDAGQAYNEAVRQVPTRWLARLYGFALARAL